MKHDLVKRCIFTAVGLLLFAGVAQATTYVVNQTSGPYTTLTSAITAANGNAGADLIQITDSATYSEAFGALTDSVTIEATGSNTPTLTRGSGSGAVLVCQPPSDGYSFVFRGASASAKMTIKNTLNTTALVGNGASPYNGRNHGITIQNVTLERTTTGTSSTGSFLNFTNQGAHTLTDVVFAGGATTNTSAILVSNSAGGAVLTNVDLRAKGTGTRVMVGNNAVAPGIGVGGPLILSNCTLAPSAGQSAYGIQVGGGSSAYGGTVTLNDCSLGTGGAISTAELLSVNNGAGTWVFNRPVFMDACGDIAFNLPSGAVGLTIAGTPTSKVDFNTIVSGGNVQPIRMRDGALNLTDCKGTLAPSWTVLAAGTYCGAPARDLNVSLNRCSWLNGSGRLVLYHTDGLGVEVPSNYAANVTANNTIWEGGGAGTDTSIIYTVAFNRSAPSLISLAHCTLYGTLTGVNPYLVHACKMPFCLVDDVLSAYYCIFESTQGATLGSNLPLGGARNIAYKTRDYSGFPLGVPAGTATTSQSVLDAAWPSATGHLNSYALLAMSTAIGSGETIDVDGDARPLGGAASDIGADEVVDTATTTVTSIADLLQQPNGFYQVTGVVTGTFGTSGGSNWFYIEDENRAAGIKCDSSSGLNLGDRAIVRAYKFHNGTPAEGYHEWVMWNGGVVAATPGDPLGSLGMLNRPFATGWTEQSLEPVGLLVAVTGTVTKVVNAQIYYIDDGSNNADASGYKGLCIYNVNGLTQPIEGANICVRGCAGMHSIIPSGGGTEVLIPVVWASSIE